MNDDNSLAVKPNDSNCQALFNIMAKAEHYVYSHTQLYNLADAIVAAGWRKT